MSRIKDIPKIGTTMYFVEEHRFRTINHSYPSLEYCVCSAEVVGYQEINDIEIVMIGKNANGHLVPYHIRVPQINKSYFYTANEAAKKAKKMTEKYEQERGCVGDKRMTRKWESLLVKK